jgi:hypothetical protein
MSAPARSVVLRHKLRQWRHRVVDPEIETYLRLLAVTARRRQLDVLVLGDSPWLWTAHQDADTRTALEMFDQLLPAAVSRHCIVGGGYHPGLFLAFVRALADAGRPLPRVVLLATNVRTFSPQWRYAPEYRFDAAIARITRAGRSRVPWLLRPTPAPPGTLEEHAEVLHRSAFGPDRTIGEYRGLIASKPGTPAEEHERRRVIFNYFYGEPADESNPRVSELRELAALVSARGSRVVAYATPVNIEGGRELLGDGFDDHIRRESVLAETTLRAAAGDALTWLPWVDALPAADFFHRYEPSEHLAEAGRRWMVAGLVDAVQAASTR